MAQTYFASIQPGLEKALLREVRRVGGKRPTAVHGGVEFDAARKRLYAAHLQLRTPTRIWLRVDEFRARDAPELYNKTRRYGWERLIGGEHTLHIRAYSSESRLYHTGKIEDAVADGLRDRFGDELAEEPPPKFTDSADDTEALRVMARIEDDRCQLSLDASGELLHRRGWRTDVGDAPLRETIAAALLETLEWSPEQGLVDPMCGSGTICVEAACRAIDKPPGLDRSFAFQKWRNFQPERYDEMREQLRAGIADHLPAPITGRDRNAEVIEAARRNADRAGVADLIDFHTAELGDLALPEHPVWIVTNPPYGDRLDSRGAIGRLLDAWQQREQAGPLAFLWPAHRRGDVNDNELLQRQTTFSNGGITVDFWRGDAADP